MMFICYRVPPAPPHPPPNHPVLEDAYEKSRELRLLMYEL